MNIPKKLKAWILLCRCDQPFIETPFAITAAFLTAEDSIPDIKKLICIFFACFSGFMAGCVFNGIADRKIDAVNPRTKDRPVASGMVTVREALCVMVFCIAVVIVSTWLIDPFYVLLLPIPIGLCLVYSLTKRFTWLCHVCLGVANASIPVGTWIVYNGWRDWRALLAGALMFFWTIGIEIIYNSQDVEYDKNMGMNSIPVRFGLRFAYNLSLLCHIAMAVVLAALIYFAHAGLIFTVGSVICCCILVYEHALVHGLRKENADKIFNLSQLFSFLLMVSAVLDKLVYIHI